MKRFLQASIGFHSKMFGAEPTRVESDCATWMIEGRRSGKPGVGHLGNQTDTGEELAELRAALAGIAKGWA